MKKLLVLLILLTGCASLFQDNQLAKIQSKNTDINGVKLGEVDAEVENTATVMAGLTNSNTNKESSASIDGNNSVLNDPEMIEKIVYVLGASVALPSLLLIFSFMLILIIREISSNKTERKTMMMIEKLVDNVSDSHDKLIEKINENPDMLKKVDKNK